MIDIVDIKREVKKQKISAFVSKGIIYLKNEIDECVQVGDMWDDHGCWEYNQCANPEIGNYYRCSKCRGIINVKSPEKYDFCPFCGRKMEGYI